MDGGERGIRTPGTAFGSTRDFQSRSFSQLGHLSLITLVLQHYVLVSRLSGLRQKNRSSATHGYRHYPPNASQWWNAVRLLLAERVGFEPTCPALNETNRFRVDPVTTTSVPLLRKNHLSCSVISFP